MPRLPVRLPIILLLLSLLIGLAALISCAPADSSAPADTEKSTPTKAAAAIQWQPYQNAVSLSEEQDKKVFLYFFADWCRYCTVMEETTFVNEAVVARLNRHFVPVRIKLEENANLAKEYSVQGVPASWFLENTGENIGGRPGYMPPEQFIELLDVVISEAYKK